QVTRRELLLGAAATGALAAVSCTEPPAASSASPSVAATSNGARPVNAPATSDALDEVLAVLEGTGPEYGGGAANHGPMAAEALVALGRGEAAVAWARRYRSHLDAPPPATQAIAPERSREALGDFRRARDWVALFERELAERPWTEVL